MAEKKITCPAEKAALMIQIMTQLGMAVTGSEAGIEAGTIVLKADLTDDQVKALTEVVTKLERRETVANILHKAGNLTTKAVDFTVNDVARPLAGVEFVNEVADAGTKTVNDVRVSDDAQKFKGSLKTIGSCFGLFDDSKSKTIKIA